MSRRPITPALVLAGLVLAGLAGCSSGGSEGSSATTSPTSSAVSSATTPRTATTTTTTASTTSAPSTTSVAITTAAPPATTTPAPPRTKGCASGSGGRPAGAPVKSVVDVDGDGKRDQAWVAQGADANTTFGISTAAGGVITTKFNSASPVQRAALVVNADQKGPVEILLDDGRLAPLYAFVDCRIQPVRGQDGDPYVFGHGFGDVGTGVGCIDTPGGPRLAGLDHKAAVGSKVAWSSTVVELDGLHARNGAVRTGTYDTPRDDAKIDLLAQTTCGDLTLKHDGVSTGS